MTVDRTAPGAPPAGESLPATDVLIVTWTADEGNALSRVLTPGHDSQTDWKHYTKNFDRIAADMVPGCPARSFRRLGTYNSDDTYKLQGRGGAVEMGDAVLGMVCQELGTSAPDYVAVRNDRRLGDRRGRLNATSLRPGSAGAGPAPDTAAD